MTEKDFISLVSPYTMTSIERIKELYNSLEYIRINNIKGDLVECGVWKGGNILGIIEYLNFYNLKDRNVWLYDTFQGMTQPEDVDVDLHNTKAANILQQVMCYSPIDEVKKNLSSSNFPKNMIKYIVGDICETLDDLNNIPEEISLLRLDTDWYKSTKKELEVLYPKLVDDGVLIIDDYGHWKGAKQATDEYFYNKNVQMRSIDYTGVKIMKSSNPYIPNTDKMNYKLIPTREELIKLVPQNTIGAEIGIFKGEFSKMLLETINPQLFYMIDPWEGNIMSGDKNGQNIEYIDGEEYYVKHIIPQFLFNPKIKILRNYSDILSLFPDNYLDWIYIDGSHEYDCVKYDLEYSYHKIKPGGFIMGHDYTNSMFPGLVYAVDEFCSNHNLEIEYLTKDGCPSYLIVKK